MGKLRFCEKVLVKARANTSQSQDLSYICFLKPQILFVLVSLRDECSNNLETFLLFIYEYIFMVMEHELNLN